MIVAHGKTQVQCVLDLRHMQNYFHSPKTKQLVRYLCDTTPEKLSSLLKPICVVLCIHTVIGEWHH